MSEQLQLIDR